MRLLVLGGTSFVGRHIVDAAIAAAQTVTLFNRGETDPDLYPGLELRRGNRVTGDLESLRAGEWDAVIDVNGYVPRHVRDVAALLTGRVRSYCFISTGSVYAHPSPPNAGESSPLAPVDGIRGEDVTVATNGPLKVLCEQEAWTAFPESSVIVRPGVVAGPYDVTDRFTYWARRLSQGGRVLGPERPDQPVQLVHPRDLGEFVIGLLLWRGTGVFNAVGPDEPMTFAGMLEACAAAAGEKADVVWAPETFLAEHKVALPLALPSSGAWDGVFLRSHERANAHGLRNRSIVETAADTLGWDYTRDWSATMSQMLSVDREAELLELL